MEKSRIPPLKIDNNLCLNTTISLDPGNVGANARTLKLENPINICQSDKYRV